jgi:deoxyribodipyrimidine photo-lyase
MIVAPPLSIVWFRQDLRLDDNPALFSAAERGAVLPVYVWDSGSNGEWSPGAASRWWLHRSLGELSSELEQRGSRLHLAKGDPAAVLPALAVESGADSVLWNHRYEPAAMAEQLRVADALRRGGLQGRAFHGSLLFGPDDVTTSSGGPFKVFTPFWKACLALSAPLRPVPAPPRLASPHPPHAFLGLDDLSLLPRGDRASSFGGDWTPGERGAIAALERFLEHSAATYSEGRNRPDVPGTSRLSPHLHYGEISPRRIWHETETRRRAARSKSAAGGVEEFQRQLGWREFAHHLIVHFPQTTDAPLRSEFSRFPWTEDKAAFEAWRAGRTGFPLVDAGMRELRATGWMHNRTRMVVASFLVKDLLLHWLDGARWFWDTLVDADLANNTLGWQWTAGCGADAAPFFRVFNPVSQGEKFDPRGTYARRWIPEIEKLPDRWIHRPWEAPPAALRAAGVTLGKTYPPPIVDHSSARRRALEAFEKVKKRERRTP